MRFEVPSALAGERIDRALALLTDWSRREVADLADAGAVTVDGAVVTKSHRLVAGEQIEVGDEPPVRGLPEAEAVTIDVRYVDDDIVVVVKPAGLVVHPGGGHSVGTLVNGLLHRFPEIATVGAPERPGIVHRLDRDTSGLLVAARSQRAYQRLVEMLARREVERRYLALVWGDVGSDRGAIDAPIGRSTRQRTRMAVREGGREAVTTYSVRERREATTLLDCGLETGRTHQIRVHLAAIGHPVVGDAAYGGRREELELDRPFLHAWRLAFDHPVTSEPLEFEDALPAELLRALATGA